MTHIFIGCDEISGSRQATFKSLSALEVTQTAEDTLTAARLEQYRTESPKGFAFVMTAHSAVTHPVAQDTAAPPLVADCPTGEVGLLQDTEAVRRGWERTMEMARHLSPKLILIRTPLSFSPSDEHRARLTWFAETLAPQAREVKAMVAWEPHGLWEPEDFVPLARSLKLVPVFDPFLELKGVPQGRGTACFALYQRRGLRASFNDFDMEELLERCEPYQRAIVIFRGPRRFRDARLAHTVWQSWRE